MTPADRHRAGYSAAAVDHDDPTTHSADRTIGMVDSRGRMSALPSPVDDDHGQCGANIAAMRPGLDIVDTFDLPPTQEVANDLRRGPLRTDRLVPSSSAPSASHPQPQFRLAASRNGSSSSQSLTNPLRVTHTRRPSVPVDDDSAPHIAPTSQMARPRIGGTMSRSRVPAPTADAPDASISQPAPSAAQSRVPRQRNGIQCAFCASLVYSNTPAGMTSYATHLMARHSRAAVTDQIAAKFDRVITRCECGRCCPSTDAPCACGLGPECRRAFRAGDSIASRAPRNDVSSSRSQRVAARAAVLAARHADSGLPTVQDCIEIVPEDDLRKIAEELDSWAGGETLVHIPVRSRPLLASIFADLLTAMVDGSVRAGLLLRCLPKLTLHRASFRVLGHAAAVTEIRRRAALLLRGKIGELATLVREQRVGLKRMSEKRARHAQTASALPAVANLARHGAFSKAVKRLTSHIANYDDYDARRWACTLIPNPPDGSRTLGDKPISDAERPILRDTRTCADSFDPRPKDSHPTGSSSTNAIPVDAAETDDDNDDVAGDASDGDEPRRRPRAPPAAYKPPASSFGSGVRFGALSAPGPSGLRPEHIRAFGMSRNVAARQKYEAAMRRFVAAAVRGDLPHASCWWITDSSLTFAKKPGSGPLDAPRPLRVGETLRRFVAKRIAAAERAKIQRVFVRRRQFGVACPGGAEVLIHYRMQTRDLANSAASDGIGEWDNDLRNCYGSLFWPSIDSSIAAHVPGALPWTRWSHSARVRVLLPGGRVHLVNRGAEQGDPLGPLYASAVIADVCESASTHALAIRDAAPTYTWNAIQNSIETMFNRIKAPTSDEISALLDAHRQRLATESLLIPAAKRSDMQTQWDAYVQDLPVIEADTPLRRLDVWYLDDSFVRASLVDGDFWLAALDIIGATVGLQRSTTKSSFRLPSTVGAPPPYTAQTCTVEDWRSRIKFLGVEMSDPAAQFVKKTDEVKDLHAALRGLNEPAIELLLIRQCAEVSRVTHLLRAIGPLLSSPFLPAPHPARPACHGFGDAELEGFDDLMRDAVGQVVRAPISDDAAMQASWGVKAGGLGLRTASAVALPAHVASIVEATPFVAWLADQSVEHHVGSISPDSHQRRCKEAVDSLLEAQSDECLRAALQRDIDSAALRAAKLARSIFDDDRPPPDPPPLPYTAGSSPALIPDVGETDPERVRPPPTAGSGGSVGLQHRLLHAIDIADVKAVIDGLSASDEPADKIMRARLADLANSNTNHEWLWAVNPAHGFTLSPDHYRTAIRLRLGLPVSSFAGEHPCAECVTPLSADDVGNHALLCARGQRVIGHNAIRDHIHSLARCSDPQAIVEASSSPPPASARPEAGDPTVDRLRPADILTSAASFGGAGSAAIDVGIVAPHTGEALRELHRDPIDEYKRRKIQEKTSVCQPRGWSYHPFILSAFGRADDDAIAIIHSLAVAASKAFGGSSPARTERAWWRNAGTLLMERAARMVEKCRPSIDLPPILSGVDEDAVGGLASRSRREPPVRSAALVSGGDAAPTHPD